MNPVQYSALKKKSKPAHLHFCNKQKLNLHMYILV